MGLSTYSGILASELEMECGDTGRFSEAAVEGLRS